MMLNAKYLNPEPYGLLYEFLKVYYRFPVQPEFALYS